MILLSKKLQFPDVENATPEGVLAIGGDLSPERLMLAYRSGIFPWYDDGSPIVWWSPDPRMVLFPEELKVSKSMKQVLKKAPFTVTWNTEFEKVITACSEMYRPGQYGTWISDEMIDAYVKLHKMGVAKSVEVWEEDTLVGGLYGIHLGHVFCGESMFSSVSNASKYGFYHWVQKLKDEGCELVDCQVYTDHLASLGAREISREVFMEILRKEDPPA